MQKMTSGTLRKKYSSNKKKLCGDSRKDLKETFPDVREQEIWMGQRA